MLIFPKYLITLKIQNHFKVIFSVLHDTSCKQPPANLSVILRYKAASLDIWFPTIRENVVVSPSRVGISKRNVTPLDIAEDQVPWLHCWVNLKTSRLLDIVACMILI
jgi:hypothetical protein